jgi:hypothetical protein
LLLVSIFSLAAIFMSLTLINNPLLADLFSFQKTIFQTSLRAWIVTTFAFASLVWLYRVLKSSSQIFVPLVSALVAVLVFFQGPVVNGFALAVGEHRLADQLKAVPAEFPLYSYHYEYYGTIFRLHRAVSLVGWRLAPFGVILVKERDYEKFKTELGSQTRHRVVDKSQGSVVQYGNRVLIIEFGSALLPDLTKEDSNQ